MEPLFLPVLHSFETNNIFTGSFGLLRFRAVPDVIMKTPKEVDLEASSIRCEYWHGIYCYEKSEMEDSRVFSMSEEGLLEMRQWLEAQILPEEK